jgi:hypothetical protein
MRRLIYGPWLTSRNFRLSAYALLVIVLGFGVAGLAAAVDSLVLLAVGEAIMIPGLGFMFYLAFSKDRPDGT